MEVLSLLGLSDSLREQYETDQFELSSLARVIREHKELYQIQNASGIFNAEITGNLRYAAESRADFPAVGDWVETSIFDENQAIIHKVLPRFSLLERQSVGAHGEKQIIAVNINKAFIVQSVDRDFNLNRLERYMVLALNGGIEPLIILNKTDLTSEDQLKDICMQVQDRVKDKPIFTTSTLSGAGLSSIKEFLKIGDTYCFIGSSGVGKSTIINYLLGESLMSTKEISSATSKGQHTTTHRELIVLEDGGVLIDTPGMREVGMTEAGAGMEMTFEDIVLLAKKCRFKNCTHESEPGCKVLEAVEEGTISVEELDNFKKLERQSAHFTSTVAEKRKKDKAFGKMIKNTLSVKKKTKY